MRAYYNEHNQYAAQWLRNLVAEGLLPGGDVDDRDIRLVRPDDLAGYTQCHFFCGVGGWPLAATLAGWPAERELWTGSCPCQPFSIAGRRRGKTDHRHLWPDFHRLIRACRPAVVMGEQVTGAAGEDWISGVCADLEADSFAVRPVDVTAYAIGAPHERQRLYWIAERLGDLEGVGRREGWSEQPRQQRELAPSEPTVSGWVVHSDSSRQLQSKGCIADERGWPSDADAGGMEDAHGGGRHCVSTRRPKPDDASTPDDAGFWQDAEDLWCEWDQKWRRAQPSIPFLVDGLPGRVDAFSAFGNAVVVPLAVEVVAAYLDCAPA